ncbi:MAG TPA: hypothetical protein VGI82_01790 [Chitinophagaceae bacterium]
MMRKILIPCFYFLSPAAALGQNETLLYHTIQTDKDGNITPWYNADPAKSYDHVINLVWNFWDTMRTDINGLPYYMNHQVWRTGFDDPRGMGGDQLQMALSSWRFLYEYTGNERVKENMCFIAGYYLTHGLSPSNCLWPDIPFPYNTLIYSGIFDGDMTIGKDFTQPDKAGSFGLELVHLYKIKNNDVYLDAAIKIANTLIAHIHQGDADHSPLPFKVNVFTGKPGFLKVHANERDGKSTDTACYTSNWAPAMQLFLDLIQLNKGKVSSYKKAFTLFLTWMKKYPLATNKWGPFFEDVAWWSDTQINAMTFARFIMENREYFPEWRTQVKNIIEWVHKNFANDKWKKYSVIVTNEQTIYQTPGESHTSRQGADELLYTSLSGDSTYYFNAIRQLTWATYMVDVDGKNCFPFDENWLTDGYGDYVRHYLRAMATMPSLAPDEDHILSTTSVIQQVDYKGSLRKFLVPDFDNVDTNKVRLFYRAFDNVGTERIRMKNRPSRVLLNDKPINENTGGEGYEWKELSSGGLLTVNRQNGNRVIIIE